MKRNITNKINWVLDNLLPPILRDSKLFMSIPFSLLWGEKKKYYLEFKERLPKLNEEEVNHYYEVLQDTFIKKTTDLNSKCLEFILDSIECGESVLDAAAGTGYLASQIWGGGRACKKLYGR